MKPTVTWVVTFDGARVRAFDWRRADRTLNPIALGVDPGGHHPAFRDRPVRTHASVGPARGAGDPKTDSERELEARFVAAIVAALTQHAAAHAFDRLVVAAPPRVLGSFRAQAPPALIAKLQAEIGHDYVNTPDDALLTAIEGHVAP
ncbi:MAG: host attachment protein [Alphaproteobacteria bacterium]|nr:host attachment protein [Alphaproteobacteria bacterium]